jgi:hypothetical protein
MPLWCCFWWTAPRRPRWLEQSADADPAARESLWPGRCWCRSNPSIRTRGSVTCLPLALDRDAGVECLHRVNSRRKQGSSERPLCPPNQTNNFALLRVRRTNGSFQQKAEANSQSKGICDKRLAEAVSHPLVASTAAVRIGWPQFGKVLPQSSHQPASFPEVGLLFPGLIVPIAVNTDALR